MTFGTSMDLDLWVAAKSAPGLACVVYGDDARFVFGTQGKALHVLVSAEGLEKLARVANEAWTRFDAIPDGEDVNFTVTTDGNEADVPD